MKTAVTLLALVALVALAGLSLVSLILPELTAGHEALFRAVTGFALAVVVLVGGGAWLREKRKKHD